MSKHSTSSSMGYPQQVRFTKHYSIFLLAFEHGVTYQKLCSEKKCHDYAQTLFDIGWRPHVAVTHPNQRMDRPFSPDVIFSPQSFESAFGTTTYHADQITASSMGEHIWQRFNPNGGDANFSEPIILTMESLPWLDTPLRCRKEVQGINGELLSQEFEFEIDWVDLWLLSDSTGFIAFKAKQLGECSISSLSTMNLTLRDRSSDNIFISPVPNPEDQRLFWNDLILTQWLGFSSMPSPYSSVLLNQDICDEQATKAYDVFDPYQRYCKILIFAQTPDIRTEDLLAWGRPLSDPIINYNKEHVQSLAGGKWDLTLTASQNAIIAGYATVRDMVCFELATFSAEGGSLGLNGGRGWQYNLEYIRKVVDEQFIEVWEYWAGLVLRDTCVFVSHDKSMPIQWQAEARYYPLYLYTYHSRYRLDQLSQQIIDHDMADATRGYKLRDQYQRFRNHYCFHEVTTDFMGKEIFDKMQLGLEVGKAHESVKMEIEEVSQHLREKWEIVVGSLISIWIIITTLGSFGAGRYLLGLIATVVATLGIVYYKNPQHPLIHRVMALWKRTHHTVMRWVGRV